MSSTEVLAVPIAPHAINVVCEVDGKPKGLMILMEDPRELHVDYLATNPELRRQGIGSMLMCYAEQCARNLGKESVELCSVNGAIGFYESLGFVRGMCGEMKKVLTQEDEMGFLEASYSKPFAAQTEKAS